MRMVDIGSGWGSLTLFAAEHYGVHVTGVTLSVEQRDYVMDRAAERGLRDRVEVSLRHFRDLEASGVRDDEIDAIASIEMGEHVGDAEYVVFVDSIHRYLKPGGRVLIQQMSRSNDAPGDRPGGGPFIETYIAPDMHMKPLAKTLGLIAAAGLEIRDVQAHARALPADGGGLGGEPRGRLGRRPSSSSARRTPASGGSTSPVARWRSRRTAWASTRSSRSSRVLVESAGCRRRRRPGWRQNRASNSR